MAHDLVVIAGASATGAAAVAALRRRRGRGYDPAIVDAALAGPDALVRAADVPDAWERPPGRRAAAGRDDPAGRADEVARAVGEFADVKADFLHGHSAGGRPRLGRGRRGRRLRAEVAQVRAAGLHDVGRVGVPNGVWDKPGR